MSIIQVSAKNHNVFNSKATQLQPLTNFFKSNHRFAKSVASAERLRKDLPIPASTAVTSASSSNQRARMKKVHSMRAEFRKRKANKHDENTSVEDAKKPPKITRHEKVTKNSNNATHHYSTRVFHVSSKLSCSLDEKRTSERHATPT